MRQLIAAAAVAMVLLTGVLNVGRARQSQWPGGSETTRPCSARPTRPPRSTTWRRWALAPPAPDWFERPFGQTGLDQFVLDLRTPAPPPVRRWLHSSVTTRGFPDRGPGSYMADGTLAQWFE